MPSCEHILNLKWHCNTCDEYTCNDCPCSCYKNATYGITDVAANLRRALKEKDND